MPARRLPPFVHVDVLRPWGAGGGDWVCEGNGVGGWEYGIVGGWEEQNENLNNLHIDGRKAKQKHYVCNVNDVVYCM